MRAKATLRLDDGDEIRVEVEREDIGHQEIVVRRIQDDPVNGRKDLIAVIDEHLADVQRCPAGTIDRLLEADRQRPY